MFDLSHLKLTLDVKTNGLLRVCLFVFKYLGLAVYEDQSSFHFIRGVLSVMTFTTFTFAQLWQAYQARDNMQAMPVFGTIGLQFFTIMVRLIDYCVGHGKFAKISREISEDNRNTLNGATQKERDIINSYFNYGRKLSIFLIMSTQISGFVCIYIQLENVNFRFDKVLVEPMVPPLLSPKYALGMDKYAFYCNIFNIGLFCVAVPLVPAWHAFQTVLTTHAIMNLDLLNHRLKHFDEYITAESKSKQSDQACEFLSKCVERQLDIKRYVDLLGKINGAFMQLDFAVYSIQLCLMLFQISTASDSSLLFFCSNYITTMIAILWLYSYHGNEVYAKSDETSMAAYTSNWNKYDKRVQKIILQIMVCSEQPIIVKGGFTNITLNTFINILKASYSYFTLLRQTID